MSRSVTCTKRTCSIFDHANTIVTGLVIELNGKGVSTPGNRNNTIDVVAVRNTIKLELVDVTSGVIHITENDTALLVTGSESGSGMAKRWNAYFSTGRESHHEKFQTNSSIGNHNRVLDTNILGKGFLELGNPFALG
jgi:hypothetical protein